MHKSCLNACAYPVLAALLPLVAFAAKDPALDQYLIEAIVDGQTSAVKTLLGKGADPNGHVPDGRTLLMYASELGWHPIVEYLLGKGADAKAVDASGVSAFMWAIAGGNVPILKRLLAKGADLSLRDREGNTALMVAASHGRLEALDFFLSKGTDINARNQEGATAMMLALRHRKLSVAGRLVEKGADVSAMDNAGSTAFSDATAAGLLQFAEMARSTTTPPAVLNSNDRALVKAIEKGDTNAVRALLEDGANPKVRTGGSPAFMMSNTPEIVGLLLDKGADVDAYNWSGVTPLMYAARMGKILLLEMLLSRGANPNAEDDAGVSVLAGAALFGQNDSVSALLAFGADPALQSDIGLTALMQASHAGALLAATRLIAGGAPVNATATRGLTALMFAASNNHKDMARLLLGKGADRDAETIEHFSAADLAERAGHKGIANLIRTPPEVVIPEVTFSRDRPYAVLRILTAQDVDRVEQTEGKKWPEREPIDEAAKSRLHQRLENMAQPLGADELVLASEFTENDAKDGVFWKYALLAVAYNGLNQAKYGLTAPRLPGGVTAAAPFLLDPVAIGAAAKSRTLVERKHSMAVFALKYGDPSVPRPQSGSHEDALWRQAEKTDAVGPYRVYLSRFPQGSLANLAQAKLAQGSKAVVWIYRTDDFRPTIFLNGKPVLRIGGGHYARLLIDPGVVELQAGDAKAKKLTLDVQSGREYFLRSYTGWTGDFLVADEETKAIERIQKGKPVEPKWVQDPVHVRLN